MVCIAIYYFIAILFATLKTRDIGQELWLSIGGWTFSDNGSPTATTFSDLVSADETRQNVFFASLILFMQTWGFSGVDIDWEYPVDHDRNGRESDFKAYPRFMKRLRSALHDYKYGLSVTLPTSYWYLQHFDLENLEPSVDWFNVMSYDLHGAWDIGNKWTGAFVGAHTNLTEIKSSLDLLWRNKVSPSKVVLGLAFYGRAVTLASPSCPEPGCPYLSAGDAGKCSGEAGILFNSEITDLIHDKKLRPKLYKDAAVKTIQWNDDQWVSYDDKDTWKLKANFLKSQCLSGVLVWAVDYDDYKHSYSKGLAAALGIKINVDSGSGLTLKLPDKKEKSKDFCYFTNCGQTCPSGYTEIVRDDKKSELMLDSTQCPPGSGETQTLCCPKSSKVPTCRWRGFKNNGHCVVGCNPGEAEVGSTRAGCTKSGWQSACCDVTESTDAWSKCQWTDDCFDDDTCPKGYSSFIAESREGWGGQRSCKSGKYNYCCTETPKAFKNCEWTGHQDYDGAMRQLCTDSCPHGSTRIAEQSLTPVFGSRKSAYTKDCIYGNEAYCCAGDTESDKDERSVPEYQDRIAEQFDELLQKFIRDPVCSAEEQSKFSTEQDMFTRDLFQVRATDQGPVLEDLVPIMVNWLTAEHPRPDMEDIYQMRLQQFGFESTAGNLSTYTDLLYQGDWSGRPLYSPTLVVIEALCDLGDSRDGMENLAAAPEALCEYPSETGAADEKRHLLEPRRLSEASMASRDGNQPTVAYALRGIRSRELSLHYVRWLQSLPPNSPPGTRPTQVILEVGYWIGRNPGQAPSQTVRTRYGDNSHSLRPDRWIVFHFHIPLDSRTFMSGANSWYLGVEAMSVYHSHDVMLPNAVHVGQIVDYRAEYRYSNTYASGTYNTGPYQDYNDRSRPFSCYNQRRGHRGRWYLGNDYSASIRTLRNRGRPDQLAELINSFGMRLHAQGISSLTNLQRIWPQLQGSQPSGQSGSTLYNPVPGAFDQNWLPNGNTPADPNAADP